MKIVIKLGGGWFTKEKKSFPITIKEIKEHAFDYINLSLLERFGAELNDVFNKNNLEMVLANGAGPFGHHLVKNKIDPEVVHESVAYLNSIVVDTLRKYDVPAHAVAPYDYCYSTSNKNTAALWQPLEAILKEKQIPVSYGDCAPKRFCVNYEVISADDIVVTAGENMPADKILMFMDVGGIYTKHPKFNNDAKIIPEIVVDREYSPEDFHELLTKLGVEFGPGKAADVTGGIFGKTRKLCNFTYRSGIPSQITGYQSTGDLLRALKDEGGTKIVKWQKK